MARIVTKELALKIVGKLSAVKIKSRSTAHDLYEITHEGRIIATTSVRRGSEKDKGHDHMPRDLRISPRQAKLLGQCPWSRDNYIQSLRERRLLGEEEPEAEDE